MNNGAKSANILVMRDTARVIGGGDELVEWMKLDDFEFVAEITTQSMVYGLHVGIDSAGLPVTTVTVAVGPLGELRIAVPSSGNMHAEQVVLMLAPGEWTSVERRPARGAPVGAAA